MAKIQDILDKARIGVSLLTNKVSIGIPYENSPGVWKHKGSEDVLADVLNAIIALSEYGEKSIIVKNKDGERIYEIIVKDLLPAPPAQTT